MWQFNVHCKVAWRRYLQASKGRSLVVKCNMQDVPHIDQSWQGQKPPGAGY